MNTVKQIKKPTMAGIIKTVVDNSKEHLLNVNKKLRTNNLHLQRILEDDGILISDEVRDSLCHILAQNLIVINSNKLFNSVEVLINEDDGN